jgi:protein-tyrosine phosphatase
MDILVVCHANVCRSRAAEAFLSTSLDHLGFGVESAGVQAADRGVTCPETTAYLRSQLLEMPDHEPRQLTPDLIAAADLVLTTENDTTAAVVELLPGARRRVFRLMWAATAMTHVAGYVAAGEVPPGAPPLEPSWDDEARWAWLVSELDAARGQLPAPARLGGDSFYDVNDPHARTTTHADALDRIAAACEQLAGSAAIVVQRPLYAVAG